MSRILTAIKNNRLIKFFKKKHSDFQYTIKCIKVGEEHLQLMRCDAKDKLHRKEKEDMIWAENQQDM